MPDFITHVAHLDKAVQVKTVQIEKLTLTIDRQDKAGLNELYN